ncbi:MAG: DUF2752 domain-containing protein [Actinobacteria bacterium]|nr:DUF2752 domain-containing protein [Actinomycetota bacterium]MCB9388267.1 DUF2752 domain-containing protein [Acidimicrobiia bacterium]
MRTASITGAAAVWAFSASGIDAVLCPMRAITGVPCPFCGTTTAAASLLHADPIAALNANPLIVVVVVMILAAWSAVFDRSKRGARTLSGFRMPVWGWGVIIAAAWIFELHRFNLIG